MRLAVVQATARQRMLPTNKGYLYDMEELEQIEDRARSAVPTDPEIILRLTAYLRDVLQQKTNAEAVAALAVSRAGLKSSCARLEQTQVHRDLK